MVEIIGRRGTPKTDRKYETRCRECETKFSFQRSEAEYVSDQRDGDALVIKCPVCGHKIWHGV